MKSVTLFLILAGPTCVSADEIQTLQAVGEFAKGTQEARSASETLQVGGAANLIPILKGFQGSSKLASNWLRSTFEAIADSELKAGRDLPKGDLLSFVKDTSNHPSARRLAYEWVLKRSPQLKDQLIPEMLLDPSPEFRRDAVQMLIEKAQQAEGQEATAIWQKALSGAVHEDQVSQISKALKEQEVEVNIQQHFGFLSDWTIIGPFDNKEEKGYAKKYPPESSVDPKAEYEGQLGPVKWEPIQTDDDYGVVNIAEDIENHKGSLMYATTIWKSTKPQSLQVRLGTPNAWKLWVNGELVFQREEYHRSTRMDQYQIPVQLKAGDNRILLKVCQNEQEQSWAQRYQFQLRVCDATGSSAEQAR